MRLKFFLFAFLAGSIVFGCVVQGAQMELPSSAVLGEEIILKLVLEGKNACLVFTPYGGGEPFTYSCFFKDGEFPLDTSFINPGTYLLELIDEADGEVLATSVLTITSEPTLQLQDVFARPNPLDLTVPDPKMEFVNVPSGSTVRIFDLGGELVINLTGTVPILWDGRNQDGDLVSAGAYIFNVHSPDGGEFTGRMAVIK